MAGLDHRHTILLIFDQPLRERRARGVLRAVEIGRPARFQNILEDVPCEFMSGLERLDAIG